MKGVTVAVLLGFAALCVLQAFGILAATVGIPGGDETSLVTRLVAALAYL